MSAAQTNALGTTTDPFQAAGPGGSWVSQLQPASWRGVRFWVRRSRIVAGRKTAEHEYPFRDVVWVEDLGKKGRRISFEGFVVGDNCYAQEQAMLAAMETAGAATLVHPSLGALQVTNVGFTSAQDMDQGRSVSFSMEFVQGAPSPIYPGSSTSTQNASINAANAADTASATDFVDDLNNAVSPVAAFASGVTQAISDAEVLVQGVAGTLYNFCGLAQAAVGTAATILNCVAGLIPPVGYTYGPYVDGALGVPQVGVVSAAQALANLTTAIGAFTQAQFSAVFIATLGVPANQPPAIQALIAAAQAVAIDPADQVQLLTTLAGYYPPTVAAIAPIGVAQAAVQTSCGALCRRAALTALARACAAYEPVSYNDAVTLLENVSALFDAEILIAADAADLNTYQAFRAMRTAVVVDLSTRAAALPTLTTITTNLPMPALALAFSLYSDATRSDQLVAFAQPIHPAFMPTSFVGLSA
jgi:prophage DNA circulation protein